MNTAANPERALVTVPLLNAVFCVNCETISNSPHDACRICGSHSLINLCRVLGGTLWNRKPQSGPSQSKYRLELNARLSEIPATDLNLLFELLSRLAGAGGDVESRLQVEPAFDIESTLKVA
jgi:hypothetical protein